MLKLTVQGKFIANAVVKKWKPFPEQKGVTTFDLKSGMEVILKNSFNLIAKKKYPFNY